MFNAIWYDWIRKFCYHFALFVPQISQVYLFWPLFLPSSFVDFFLFCHGSMYFQPNVRCFFSPAFLIFSLLIRYPYKGNKIISNKYDQQTCFISLFTCGDSPLFPLFLLLVFLLLFFLWRRHVFGTVLLMFFAINVCHQKAECVSIDTVRTENVPLSALNSPKVFVWMLVVVLLFCSSVMQGTYILLSFLFVICNDV